MRFQRLVSSAGALFGLGLLLGCSDELRGVAEPPYHAPPGEANSSSGGTSSGATPSTAGKSSGHGGKGSSGGNDATGNAGGDGDVGTASGCDVPWSAGLVGADDSCDLDNLPDGGVVLKGDITKDLSLPGGKSYVLHGETRVMGGASLILKPCTKIIGENHDAVLLIRPGAKIEAVGEQDAPILFTSSQPKGSRAPGDWGGLIILGNARNNQATNIVKPPIEGLVHAEFYGSNTDAQNGESSGSLVYVRVEYVGKQIAADNEINGITFGAVGSGTKVSHVEVANCTDDCFEWFGGTVNADHLISLNCDDDEFDTDNDFSGTVQFAFGRQFLTTQEADSNGFEMDTANPAFQPGPPDPNGQATLNMMDPVLPLTTTKWSNVTLCGQGPEQSLSPPRIGAVLRRNVAASITNTILTGFAYGGLSVRDDSKPVTTHSLVFENGKDGMTTVAPQPDNKTKSEPGTFFVEENANGVDAPPGHCDCWANPPAPFPLEAVEGGTPFGEDADANYIGAFKRADVASNWMIGKWVSWDEE